MEIADDALRHHLANALNLLQLFQSGIHQGVDVLEMARQQLGGSLSHEPDAQGEDHTFEGHLLRGSDAIDDALG